MYKNIRRLMLEKLTSNVHPETGLKLSDPIIKITLQHLDSVEAPEQVWYTSADEWRNLIVPAMDEVLSGKSFREVITEIRQVGNSIRESIKA